MAALAACGGDADAPAPRALVTIPPRVTLDAAVESLAAKRVIGSPRLFRLYAKLRGLGGTLKSGVYLLRQSASWSDVVAALARGRGVESRFRVPEGLMLEEVAQYAAVQLGIRRDSFLAAARDPALLAELGVPEGTTSAEGYLFPTTYLVPLHIGARELVRVMTRQFLEQWAGRPDWQARLDSLRLSRHELVTLASIVESEVRYDPDRPYIAAVYHNRLARRMRLEADPTVIYAHGRRLRRVWEKNLAVRSPYNTYLHAGLPPGPIGQPGRASLEAALYPARLPFLFFVAQPDGKHIFSVTYAEHLAAIRQLRQMRRGSRVPRAAGR